MKRFDYMVIIDKNEYLADTISEARRIAKSEESATIYKWNLMDDEIVEGFEEHYINGKKTGGK